MHPVGPHDPSHPESEWGSYGPLVVGTDWQRKPPGRERVTIRRLWSYRSEGPAVRAHPCHGGRPLIADADWFIENYTRSYTCEYCGGPSDLPQVCDKCGEP